MKELFLVTGVIAQWVKLLLAVLIFYIRVLVTVSATPLMIQLSGNATEKAVEDDHTS